MSGTDEITVITINYYSVRLVKRLIHNLRLRSAHPEALRFLVVDNTCGNDQELPLLESDNCRLIPGVPEIRQGKKLIPEQTQADALNLALPSIKTPFALAVDADVHVFCQGWDDILIEQMKQDVNCIAVGIPLPRWKIGTFRTFPAPAFCLIRMEAIRALGVNWTVEPPSRWQRWRQNILLLGPLVTRRRYEESSFWRACFERWSRCFRRGWSFEAGQSMARATARLHLRTRLLDHVLYPELNPKSTHPVLVELAKNFELYNYNNKPFLTHRGSGRCRRWRKDRTQDTVYWLECIRFIESAES